MKTSFATVAAFIVGLGLAAPAVAQTPPNVLVVGQIAEPKSLDPATVTAVNDFRILMNLYDGLVRYKDGALEVEPSLATDWQISGDGLVYTFNLRRGVKFHDGTDFDAAAVEFNFQRMLDEDHPYHDTGPFPLSFFFSTITEVEALGRDRVRFTLSEPYAPFLSNLAYPTGLIVSPEGVKNTAAISGATRPAPARFGSANGRPIPRWCWSATPPTGAARRRWKRWCFAPSPTATPGSRRCCPAASM